MNSLRRSALTRSIVVGAVLVAMSSFAVLPARAADMPEGVQELRLANSPTIIRMFDGADANGVAGRMYAIAFDGGNFSRALPVSDVVRLRYAEFEAITLALLTRNVQ